MSANDRERYGLLGLMGLLGLLIGCPPEGTKCLTGQQLEGGQCLTDPVEVEGTETGEGEGEGQGEGEGEGTTEGEGEGNGVDGGLPADGGQDGGPPDSGVEGEGEGSTPITRCEAGFVCLTLALDDQVNRLFDAAANLEWTGNFKLEPPDGHEIVLDPVGGRGPYPKLYDDGSPPAGHEKPGAKAGDSIWTTMVRLATPTPESPIELTYSIRQGGFSIWSGPEERLRITSADDTEILAAIGLTRGELGRIDLRLELSTEVAQTTGGGVFQDFSQVKVKGSFSNWTLLPCDDIGQGIFRCDLSENVGRGTALPYSGLLECGLAYPFVFTLGVTDQEYRVNNVPPAEGVTAYLNSDGSWSRIETIGRNLTTGLTQVTTPPCQ